MYPQKKAIAFIIILFLGTSSFATDYYVNAKTGNDSNDGQSPNNAWKSLFKVSQKNFKPGDKILLATGQEFKGSIKWNFIKGTKSKPITITSYIVANSLQKPIINAKNYLNGILLETVVIYKLKGLQLQQAAGKN